MAANLICAWREQSSKNGREIKFASIDLPMNSRVLGTIGAIRVVCFPLHLFSRRVNLLEFKMMPKWTFRAHVDDSQ